MTKPTQPRFFPSGEDLPPFTGEAHNFYPERDSSGVLCGKPVRLPAKTPVRLVKREHNQPSYIVTDCLVENSGLYTWVHHSELGIESEAAA